MNVLKCFVVPAFPGQYLSKVSKSREQSKFIFAPLSALGLLPLFNVFLGTESGLISSTTIMPMLSHRAINSLDAGLWDRRQALTPIS